MYRSTDTYTLNERRGEREGRKEKERRRRDWEDREEKRTEDRIEDKIGKGNIGREGEIDWGGRMRRRGE